MFKILPKEKVTFRQVEPLAHELSRELAVGLRFAYRALYGALPSWLQKKFVWEESLLGEQPLITVVRMLPYDGAAGEPANERACTVYAVTENGSSLTVYLRERNGPESWRVVGASYDRRTTTEGLTRVYVPYIVIIEPFVRHGMRRTESYYEMGPGD